MRDNETSLTVPRHGGRKKPHEEMGSQRSQAREEKRKEGIW